MKDQALRDNSVGALCIAITLLCWSSVPLFLKYFTAHIDAWTANGWRYGISALIWLPLLAIQARRGRLPKGLLKLAIVPALFNACGQTLFAQAPYYIGPALMTFMLRFQIIVIGLGAYVLFVEERPILRSWQYWAGVAAVFAGSVGTALLGDEIPRDTQALGVVLAIAAGIFFAGYSLSVRYFMSGMSSAPAFAAISLCTAIILVTVMVFVGEQSGGVVLELSGGLIALLALSAFVGIAMSHVLYYASIARLGVAVAAGVIFLQPFVAGLGSYFLFGERLTVLQWASGAGAVAGAVIMLRTHHVLAKKKARETDPSREDRGGL